MSNLSKDHPSIKVHAPPGGHSNNIFSTSEFEQSAANKKKHMESDIFGSKKDTTEPAHVAKQTHQAGNNIFGSDPVQNNTSAGTLAGQYKQTQMKSNIFGTDEPTAGRTTSDKNKSNIFGIGDNQEQNKQQGAAARHGRRVGYNPINGEAYTPKENVNANDKETDSTVKTTEVENDNGHVDNAQVAPTDTTPTPSASVTENKDVKQAAGKNEDSTNENNAQKNVHTSVRVFHPPGGKSNGPLW